MKAIKEIKEVGIWKISENCWYWEVCVDLGFDSMFSKNFKSRKSCENHFKKFAKLNGIGKTHLAICCLRKYLFDRFEENENFEVSHFKNYFYKERTIFYELMESYKDKKNEFKTEKEIINFYCGLPILILDDLFSNRINEFARRIVLDIIDERIDWKGLPTVITSNLDMNGISEIDNRIASRLSSGIVFDFTTQIKDFRIK